jgi:predicted anti-sigma-YlaC factor YlaD
MNCQLCQENLEAYQEGKLPSDKMTQVESHLKTCDSCKRLFEIQILAGRVIGVEKETDADPFLATRVMAQIERLDAERKENTPLGARIFRPVLITLSLAAAVFFGIMLGNLSRPAGNFSKVPLELALINDVSLESVDILSLE